MAYGNLLTDVVQSSTTGTPPVFKDGNGTEVGTLCRAWLQFDGSGGSVVIKGSYNISSVVRTALGRWSVTFTNPMPDANYSVSGQVGTVGSFLIVSAWSSTVVSIASYANSTYYDNNPVTIAIHR